MATPQNGSGTVRRDAHKIKTHGAFSMRAMAALFAGIFLLASVVASAGAEESGCTAGTGGFVPRTESVYGPVLVPTYKNEVVGYEEETVTVGYYTEVFHPDKVTVTDGHYAHEVVGYEEQSVTVEITEEVFVPDKVTKGHYAREVVSYKEETVTVGYYETVSTWHADRVCAKDGHCVTDGNYTYTTVWVPVHETEEVAVYGTVWVADPVTEGYYKTVKEPVTETEEVAVYGTVWVADPETVTEGYYTEVWQPVTVTEEIAIYGTVQTGWKTVVEWHTVTVLVPSGVCGTSTSGSSSDTSSGSGGSSGGGGGTTTTTTTTAPPTKSTTTTTTTAPPTKSTTTTTTTAPPTTTTTSGGGSGHHSGTTLIYPT